MNEKILPKEYLSGILKTGEISLECYVLDNGMRVITKRGMQKALGIPASKSGTILENFLLSYKSYDTKPQNFIVIESGFKNVSKFRRKGAGGSQPDSMAFEATFLMDVCHFIQDLKQYCTIPPEWDFLHKNATIIERALPFVFGAAGLLLLIYIIMGGFQLMFSRGDPKAVAAGWAKVTNAVIGFILVILAFALVSIIGRVFGISVFSTIFGNIGPGR
jgi:hypothetical protein